jgi:hypothetical protein
MNRPLLVMDGDSFAHAPTAAKKFSGPEASPRNARDLRRYILKRWIEHGRQETVVICQQRGEAKLKALGLPETIHVEHYNDVSGIDRYKAARLLILAGRILPEPDKLESLAGALTGVAPQHANTQKNGGRWYDTTPAGIRMGDGTGWANRGDRHPDPTVEAVRWQSCGGELLQALGRVRGVNRTAGNPVQIDILTNVALPVTADEVMTWATAAAGEETEMLAEGVMLTQCEGRRGARRRGRGQSHRSGRRSL